MWKEQDYDHDYLKFVFLCTGSKDVLLGGQTRTLCVCHCRPEGTFLERGQPSPVGSEAGKTAGACSARQPVPASASLSSCCLPMHCSRSLVHLVTPVPAFPVRSARVLRDRQTPLRTTARRGGALAFVTFCQVAPRQWAPCTVRSRSGVEPSSHHRRGVASPPAAAANSALRICLSL